MVWRKQQQAEVDETKTVAYVAVLVVNTHTHMYRAVLLIEERCHSAKQRGERDKVEKLHSCTVGTGGQQQQLTPVRWQWCEDLEDTAQPSTVFTCVVCKHRRAPARVCVA